MARILLLSGAGQVPQEGSMTTVHRTRALGLSVGLAVMLASGSCRKPSPAAESTPEAAPGTPGPAQESPAANASVGAPPDPFSWAAAIARVEEVRGSAGRIEVPPELKHYDDRRRFLAVQMADSQEERYSLPHDVAALAEMIRRGELVGLRALGEEHILYDVGTDAREDPLA